MEDEEGFSDDEVRALRALEARDIDVVNEAFARDDRMSRILICHGRAADVMWYYEHELGVRSIHDPIYCHYDGGTPEWTTPLALTMDHDLEELALYFVSQRCPLNTHMGNSCHFDRYALDFALKYHLNWLIPTLLMAGATCLHTNRALESWLERRARCVSTVCAFLLAWCRHRRYPKDVGRLVARWVWARRYE